MKAIIEVSRRGSAVRSARTPLAAIRRGVAPKFRLSFESAGVLFADLTPARVELLDTLRRVGPCSVDALARAAKRDGSDVLGEVGRLQELGLIERTDDGSVPVPYEAVEIVLPLAQVA
jgi:predicted transcriptional regulator